MQNAVAPVGTYLKPMCVVELSPPVITPLIVKEKAVAAHGGPAVQGQY